MTVSQQTPNNSSTGNGVTTVFPYTFKVLAAGDLEVLVDGVVQTLTTHYTLTGVGDNGGGNVTFVAAPASGTTVVRRRNMAYVRTTDYQDQGEMPADVLNPDQDAPVLMLQQLSEELGRAPKVPKGEAALDDLPAVADRALKYFGWDAGGQPIAAEGTGTGDAQLLAFLQAGAGAVTRSGQSKMRDIVSAADFGVAADGVTDDTAALSAFLLVANRGHIPAGTYKVTGPLTLRSNQVITGDGPATVLKYAAAVPGANPFLKFDGISHARVSDLALQVPCATYPAVRSIYMDTATDCHARGIVFTGGAGGNAAFLNVSSRCSVSRCYVDDYRSNGFYVTGGYANTIEDNDIPDGSGGLMGVQIVGGESNKALKNRIAQTPDNYFGIHVYGGNFHIVDGNAIRNTRREAIALGGSQNIGSQVTNNTMYWDGTGPWALGVGDFGMSVAGEDALNLCTEFLIQGNTIVNSAYDGIGIAGWCQRGRVVNNTIRDSARASLVTHQSGIKVYGWIAGAVADDITVESNTVSKINSTGLLYAVSESAGLGSVSGNIIRGNKSYGLTGDMYQVTTAALVALNSQDLGLITHNATPTASVGTITSAAGTLRYQRIGKFVACRLTITITNNGTGSSTLLFAMPFNASAGLLSGAETASNGKACKAGPSGSSLILTNYDNTYPGVNGASLTLTGVLELA